MGWLTSILKRDHLVPTVLQHSLHHAKRKRIIIRNENLHLSTSIHRPSSTSTTRINSSSSAVTLVPASARSPVLPIDSSSSAILDAIGPARFPFVPFSPCPTRSTVAPSPFPTASRALRICPA